MSVQQAGEQPVEANTEGVHPVICDPTYNTRRIVEPSNSEHSRLSLHDMSHYLELFSALMDLGSHGSTFCSALLFKTRYMQFVREVEEVVRHEEVLDSKEPATWKTNIIEVEAKTLH